MSPPGEAKEVLVMLSPTGEAKGLDVTVFFAISTVSLQIVEVEVMIKRALILSEHNIVVHLKQSQIGVTGRSALKK